MQLAEDVHTFGRACEHLLASVAIHRLLTEEELLLIQHYCKELLEKFPPSPTGSGCGSIKP
jgi:hypothetical protein